MQFKVPQFIDIEDKLFGPFTFSEFVYLVGGAGLCYVIYKALGFVLGFVPIAFVAGLALALVFYKPNNKPFVLMIESSLRYLTQSKLYIWKRKIIKVNPNQKKEEKEEKKGVVKYKDPRLNKSKLRDLSWSLDVLDLKN